MPNKVIMSKRRLNSAEFGSDEALSDVRLVFRKVGC